MDLCRQFDKQLLFGIYKRKNKYLDIVMCFITYLGNCGKIWIVISAYFAWKQNKNAAFQILFALSLAALGNNVLVKSLFMRKRPCDRYTDIPMLIKRPIGSSFPSGHTATSFACAIAIYALSPFIGGVAFIIAALVGISRIYLFVHYPSDVMFGMISGLSLGIIAVNMLSNIA